MIIDQRSYGGKNYRPKPEVFVQTSGGLAVIATPWGARSGAERAIESIKDFFLSSSEDREMTSPFDILTCLSPLANNLRSAIMLTNDALYREENKNEYVTGVELFVCAGNKDEFVFTQIGLPKVFLARPGQPMMPLAGTTDLAHDFSQPGQQPLAPLPQELLGIASTSHFAIHSIRPQEGDRIICMSRSHIPVEFYGLDANISSDELTRLLANNNVDQPFWVGILDFE